MKLTKVKQYKRDFFIEDLGSSYAETGNFTTITRIKWFLFIPIKYESHTINTDNAIWLADVILNGGGRMREWEESLFKLKTSTQRLL